MKKKYKLLVLAPLSTLMPMVIVACSNVEKEKEWSTKVEMAMNKGWYDDKSDSSKGLDDFLYNFQIKFKELKNANKSTKDFPDVIFSFKAANEDDNLAIQDLQSSKVDFIITNSTSVAKANPNNLPFKEILSKLQTETTSFIFDQSDIETEENYSKIVEKTQEIFDKKPFMKWNKDSEKWTGSRWDFLYDTTKNIDFYRGAILIVGDQNKRDLIKKAWKEKDWNTFRNFGILHKSSFDLHEMRLKKHFNLPNNTFTSLDEDRLLYSDKYLQKSAHQLGRVNNFSIALDYEASFAWTTNSNVKSSDNQIKFTPNLNEKIEFLTVTEARKYDIGSFRRGFNDQQAELIVNTFIELSKEGKDTYGPYVGYNGYSHYSKSSEKK